MEKKITLSIEKMKYLEELGLDTSDASMEWEYWGVNDYTLTTIEHSDRSQNNIPAYTLQDILEKLPEFAHLGPFNGEYRCVCHITHSIASKCGNTMLEASYKMLLWCIENGYIKTNKT